MVPLFLTPMITTSGSLFLKDKGIYQLLISGYLFFSVGLESFVFRLVESLLSEENLVSKKSCIPRILWKLFELVSFLRGVDWT